jgi:hypothetical protein
MFPMVLSETVDLSCAYSQAEIFRKEPRKMSTLIERYIFFFIKSLDHVHLKKTKKSEKITGDINKILIKTRSSKDFQAFNYDILH